MFWREYIHSDNPVAAALLCKMGFQQEEKVQIKLEFLRMLARLKLDPARMELIGGFFETYLKLNRQEEEQFYREMDKIDKKEAEAIMQVTTSWHEKGRAEGRIEGRIEKAQEISGKYLAKKFGAESWDIQEKVKATNQPGGTGPSPDGTFCRRLAGGGPGNHSRRFKQILAVKPLQPVEAVEKGHFSSKQTG